MSLEKFDMNLYSKKKSLFIVFGFSFFLAILFFLPHVISDRGYFFYIGDYNVQQIPFNMLANEAIKDGNIFWNWNTDLGANFIGSYVFYLLGSPFFLLQLILPTSWIPMALPWVLCLKFAVSGVTSYLYLERFVKNKNYAFLAALLYAFSSFSIYNIFFNHFNDVIALFPLLPYALEEFIEKDKKGVFAFAVFINALTNYYFFVAQVVFLIIYFFIRLYHGAWPKFNLKKFIMLALESAVGFSMAAFLILPAILTTIQLPRAGARLDGWALITYYETQRPLQIIQAFFFPPEVPSQLSFFPDAGGKWSSVSAWLPLFGMVGTVAWLRKPRKDWISRIIFLLILMAFIPPLNASFQLLSRSYYTRWFFVLILMMALATAKSLQDCTQRQFKKSMLWSFLIVAAIALPINLIKDPKTNEFLAGNPQRVWLYFLISIICIFLVYILLFRIKRESSKFFISSLIVLSIVIVGVANTSLLIARGNSKKNPVLYVDKNINGRQNIDLPNLDNIRIDVQEGEENAGMFWRIPTIHAFHSIVPGSIVSFYEALGLERKVASRPNAEKIGLRAFLSVKYIFDGDSREDIESYGYKRIEDQNGYGVWENENYIPFGFTYDYYILKTDWDEQSDRARERLLLRAIILDQEDVDYYSHLLEPLPLNEYPETSNILLSQDAEDRAQTSAYNFQRDNRGFTANIITHSDNLVFFSVPYEPGWSAKVNGAPTEVVVSNIGFMSVEVPQGDNEIRFDYMTPGLKEGIIISLTALFILVGYLICCILLPYKS